MIPVDNHVYREIRQRVAGRSKVSPWEDGVSQQWEPDCFVDTVYHGEVMRILSAEVKPVRGAKLIVQPDFDFFEAHYDAFNSSI